MPIRYSYENGKKIAVDDIPLWKRRGAPEEYEANRKRIEEYEHSQGWNLDPDGSKAKANDTRQQNVRIYEQNKTIERFETEITELKQRLKIDMEV